MKCNRCEFEHCVSNEYGTEYDCAIFGDCVPKELECDEGCNLKRNEAKKLYELHENYVSMYYECMYYECEVELYMLDREKLAKEQRAGIEKANKEYSEASKKYHNYLDAVIKRRANRK